MVMSKAQLYIKFLPKKGGARFHNVDTFIISSCQNNEIHGFQTLKSAEETGLDPNEFSHVLLSHIGNYNKEFIVKVHDSNSRLIKYELEILKKLKDFNNSINLICDFTCNENKERWLYNIQKPTRFCLPNGNNKLHFFVMEYIQDGDLATYIDDIVSTYKSNKKICFKIIKSLFLQISLAIIEMAIKYKVYHGDLNSGNILIYKTSKQHMYYEVYKTKYKVNTYGVYPIFIDFGRGGTYDKRAKVRSPIKDDICIIGSVLVAWIKDITLSNQFNSLLDSVEKANKLEDIIETLGGC
jgi:serine/threonine protein kinase